MPLPVDPHREPHCALYSDSNTYMSASLLRVMIAGRTFVRSMATLQWGSSPASMDATRYRRSANACVTISHASATSASM